MKGNNDCLLLNVNFYNFKFNVLKFSFFLFMLAISIIKNGQFSCFGRKRNMPCLLCSHTWIALSVSEFEKLLALIVEPLFGILVLADCEAVDNVSSLLSGFCTSLSRF